MRQVIFDTSFLMAVADHPTSWREDIESSVGAFQAVLLDRVEEELKALASRGGKKGKSATVALEMASGFKRLRSGSGPVDDEVMSASLTTGGAVATNDAELASSLRAMHVKVFSLRSGRVWER